MDRDLVRTAGRAEELGRPYWYATTKRFLQVFGLRHLDDLPRVEQLRSRSNSSGRLPEQTHDDATRSGGIRDNLIRSTVSEDEEEHERDHHHPV
jgi:segregation and condensation protein B